MPTITTSVVVPLDPEAAWELFFGDERRHSVALSQAVVAVEDHEIRADGTPRYTMAHPVAPARAGHSARTAARLRPCGSQGREASSRVVSTTSRR